MRYLFGAAEHDENVYLAIKSMHVSVSSTWNVINASSIGGFRSTAPRASMRHPPPIVLALRWLPCSVRLELRFRFDESSFIRSIFITWPSSNGTRTFAFKPWKCYKCHWSSKEVNLPPDTCITCTIFFWITTTCYFVLTEFICNARSLLQET